MDLKVLVDCKLIMNQQYEVAFEKGLHLKVTLVEATCPKQGRRKSYLVHPQVFSSEHCI